MLAERIAILVTGMHRSGTSALARTLSLLGASLPVDLVPPNEGNPDGHWEPTTIVEFNDRMLADAGSDLYSTIDLDPHWFTTPRAKAFVDEAAAVLKAAYASDPFIVLKDPRAALMLPIWHEALALCGYTILHVLPLRHPASVAQSLRRRHLKTIPYDGWQRPRGELVWLRYTLAAVQGSRGHARSFVSYPAFLGDWRREVRRMASELNISWPRLGLADQDIDAFLRDGQPADKPAQAGPRSMGPELATLDFAELATRLYDDLMDGGDGLAATDDVGHEYRTRILQSRDLIKTLENLYPLVWSYHEEAETQRRRNELGRTSEGNLHRTVQTLWSDLSRTNGEKGVLRHDLFTTAEHIQSLQQEVRETRTALDHSNAALDITRSALDVTRSDLGTVHTALDVTRADLATTSSALEAARSALDAAVRSLTLRNAELESILHDREAVRRDGEEMQSGLSQVIEELTTEANALEAARHHLHEANAALRDQLAGVYASSSWTLTKPLRFMARLLHH